ncbi:MAG: alpha/beta hydrolase [Ectothiorhodospiraceae bacterium]|nr:alpha/beta hydrolase [Ectothiorhodospiraceae bacterium]
MGFLLRAAALLVVIYLLLVAALYLFQSRLIHLPAVPGREILSTPERIGLDYRDVWLTTGDDVRLHGWYVPYAPSAPTLLFFHGNAGNISHRLDSLRIFHELGLNVLIIDYRGYGRSAGRPGERGLYRDAHAAVDWLRDEYDVEAEELILFGRSLGAAVASRMAAERGAAVLILESAFTSVPDLAAELYPIFPVRMLARHDYDTRAHLDAVRAPVLVVHSPDDEIVPFRHGQRLYEAAPEPRALLKLEGGHNDGFLVSGRRYTDGLREFLDQYGPGTR